MRSERKGFQPFPMAGGKDVDWSSRTPWRPVRASQRAPCGEAWTPIEIHMAYTRCRAALLVLMGILLLSPARSSAQTDAELVRLVEETKVKAEGGDAVSQRRMGWYYFRGEGVAKDEAESFKWYRKAANQGNTDALQILATCYELGTGPVPKDVIEAYACYNFAGASSASARASLADLEAKMSRDEILAGQKRTRELKAEIEANMAAKPLAASDAVAVVVSKVSEVADSKPTGTPAGEQPKGFTLVWVVFFLLLLVVIVVGGLVVVLAFKKSASIARAKASGNSHDDSKPTHGFFYYWALSSLAILTFLSALGYLNGGASGFYYQLGRGLIMAPLGGLVVGGIWKMLSK